MNSEATEPQGADDETENSEGGVDRETGDERVEARAQGAERVESESDDDSSNKPVVPAPSEASSDEEGQQSEASDETDAEETLAEDSSEADVEETHSEESLAEETSEAEAEEDSEPESRFTDLDSEAEEWLAELFERMNYNAEGELDWEDGQPLVDIGGADAHRLLGSGNLGPKAIEGIETLLQSVFSQDDAAADTYVDVDGQRAARKEMLQEVAVSMADKAVGLGEMLTISGLNSTERRIIHRQLRDYDGVDTESVGDGIFRRLTIDPN